MASQLRQWWTGSSHAHLLKSEHRLLTALVKNSFRKPRPSNDSAKSKGEEQNMYPYINWVEFESPNRTECLPTVILAHGFGSGLGFYYRNIDDLLNSGKVGRVIGVDWTGMGGSRRVSCWQSPIRSVFSSSIISSRISFCNSKFSTDDAIDFFLNPLNKWLTEGDLFKPGEEIWLVGHSLGGYLAAKYAMRLSQMQNEAGSTAPNLSKLILASPVGFQPGPAPHQRIPSSSLPPAFRLVDALWSANLTPQALVRAMGNVRGKTSIKRALQGRIPHLNQSTLDLLSEYLYHVTVAPASGEYAMNSLLEPAASELGAGVYARQPLGQGKMTGALASDTARQQKMSSIKVLFGDKDWMRFNEDAARKECESIQRNCNILADVDIIPNAGHHLYLDNADVFVNHILN